MRIQLVTKAPLVCLDSSFLRPLADTSALETGGVQWMCAGRGIIHAEMPVHAKGTPDPRGLQLWVDLPKQVGYFSAVTAFRADVRRTVQDGGACYFR